MHEYSAIVMPLPLVRNKSTSVVVHFAMDGSLKILYFHIVKQISRYV